MMRTTASSSRISPIARAAAIADTATLESPVVGRSTSAAMPPPLAKRGGWGAGVIALLSLGMASRPAVGLEKLSPAEQKIRWAQIAIEKDPARFQPYNELALALTRRARETSDASYY